MRPLTWRQAGQMARQVGLLSLLAATLQLAGCGSAPKEESPNATAERLYKEARDDIDAGTYERAIRTLERVESLAAGSLLVTEAGGLVGNFSGEANFLEQRECLAANPRVYGQMVSIVGRYSKFAAAGDKAAVRQSAAASISSETPDMPA